MAERRRWWTTWPGALTLGAAALLLGSAGTLTGLAYVVIPPVDSAGIDFEIAAPPLWKSIGFGVQALAGLVLPVLTVFWARRRWAGYVLLGLGLAAVSGVVGLTQLGIL
ncbi:hypothetical protein G7085_09885 [Tessaracoccus sp. HDW20]|uniref:hypothetical protein n=1 Tax=Tessaracoccus coleopterorum TaxID=2714950 RepID=UPI0018D2B9CA|nr:hypothetical protein [Tessaracoccus coleopterorum]NHB84807.1 hypothetical protein [Tessaracoccus coleopterorum]